MLDRCSQFQDEYNVWRQLLSPASYGLAEDTELRHITWCPDKQCANGGKGWAAHRQCLDVVAEHFGLRAGYHPSYRRPRLVSPPFHRKIDYEVKCRHGTASGSTRAPYVYRGLRFNPIEKRRDHLYGFRHVLMVL